MNSADDDEADPTRPVAGITTQIIDYYNRFGQNRDLEQYFSLTTATGEAVDPTSLLTVPDTFSNTVPLTSGLTSYKQQTNPKSTAVQFDCADDNVKHFNKDFAIKESDSEKIKLSEDSETSKEATGFYFDTSLTKPLSPTSSIASQRRLEWDSLADVGYPNDVKTTNIALSTLERMALQQYTDSDKPLHIKCMPLPTAQSTPVDNVPTKPSKWKGKGKRHMATDINESRVETQNVSSFPGSINVNLTRNISLNLLADNPTRKYSEVSSKDVPLVPNIEHSSNNMDPVDIERVDKEIQTSLRRDSPEVTNKLPVENEQDVGDKTGKYTGPIIVNIQKMKYPVYTKSSWRKRSNMHRRKPKIQTEKITTRITAPEIEPITEEMITSQELRDNEVQLSNADSFEYMSGHLYTQTTGKKEDNDTAKKDTSDKTVTSGLERKLTTPSTTTDSSKSFRKDLEGSIELLSNLLEQRNKNSDLKKQLIKKVIDKLLNTNYSSDKSASRLDDNSSRSTTSDGDKSSSCKINESSIKPILKRHMSESSSHSAPEPLISQRVNEFMQKPYSTYSLDIDSRLKQSGSNRLPSFSSEELNLGRKSCENSTPVTDSSEKKSSLNGDELKSERPFDKYLLPKNKDLLKTECQMAKIYLGDIDHLMKDLISVKLDGGGDVGERPKAPKHHTVFTLTDVDGVNQPSTSQRQLSNQRTSKESMGAFFQRYKPGGNFSFCKEPIPGKSEQNPQTHFCCCPYHQPENCTLEQSVCLGQNCSCSNREVPGNLEQIPQLCQMPNKCDNFPDQYALFPADNSRQNIECVYSNSDGHENNKCKIGGSEVEERTICFIGSELYLTSASDSNSNLNSGRKDRRPVEVITRIANVREEPSSAANKIKRSEGTVQFRTAAEVSKGKEREIRCSGDTNSTRRRYISSPVKTSEKIRISKIPQESNKKGIDPVKKWDERPDRPMQNNVNQNTSCPLQRQSKSPERMQATKQPPCPGVKKKSKEKVVRTTDPYTVKTAGKISPRRCKAMQTTLSINPKVTEPKLSDIHMITSAPSTTPSSFVKSGKSDSSERPLCTCKPCVECGRTKYSSKSHCPALETCSKLLLEAQKFDQKQMKNSQSSAKVQQKSLQTHSETSTRRTRSSLSGNTRNVATSYSTQFDDDSTAQTSQETPSQMEPHDSTLNEKVELNVRDQTVCPICGKVHSPNNSVNPSETKNNSEAEVVQSSIRKSDAQWQSIEPDQSDLCALCGKVHSFDTHEINNNGYEGDGKIRKPNTKADTASNPVETRKSLNKPLVQTKVSKRKHSKEVCLICGKVHDEFSKPNPDSNCNKYSAVTKPVKTTMNNGDLNRQVVEEGRRAVLGSSKGTSTSKSKSDTDAAHVSSNNKLKSTGHDILIETIKNIISRYSRITSDDESSQKHSKTKTRKEILRELRYLLNTHIDDASQSNNNNNSQTGGECSGAKSEEQCRMSSPNSERNSARRKFKQRAHKMHFYEESTEESPSSPADSYTYKLLKHFKKEYDKLLRKHCKCLSCENCELSCNLDSNENVETHCRKSTRRPKVLKKSVAYNLIIQSSDSFENIDQDDNKHKSRLEEVVIKIPKNSRLIPRVASDSRIDYDDLSSGRHKIRRGANSKHIMLLEMKPEYMESDGRTESQCHSEAPRSKDVDQEFSVQRYLEINRPDFLNNTERRQETIKEIQNERINRAKAKRMLVSMQLSEARNVNKVTLENMRALAKEVGLRPSRSVCNERLTMERKMKRHSEKIYNKLPEVTRKKEQMKKDQIKKTNLIMQQIFTKCNSGPSHFLCNAPFFKNIRLSESPEVTRKKEQMKKDQIKKTNLIMQQIFTKISFA